MCILIRCFVNMKYEVEVSIKKLNIIMYYIDASFENMPVFVD